MEQIMLLAKVQGWGGDSGEDAWNKQLFQVHNEEKLV